MITTQPVSAADQLVAAEPFRAQLKFLINSGGVSAEVIAELADLAPDQLRPLLRPPGRGTEDRIPVEVGRRLIMLTAAGVRATRYELVPADPVRTGLRRLLNAGWTLDRLTTYLRMRRPTIQLLLNGRALSCTRLTQLRVAAALHGATEANGTTGAKQHQPEPSRTSEQPALRPVA